MQNENAKVKDDTSKVDEVSKKIDGIQNTGNGKKGKKGKNKNKSPKPTRDDDPNDPKDYGKDSHNDPRIWGTEEQLKAAAGWSYANRLGNPLPSQINNNVTRLGATFSSLNTIDDVPEAVPGIMELMWGPTPGYSRTGNSPLNVAAYAENGFMRSNVSGKRDYYKEDVMTYFLAVSSAYMLGAHIRRAIMTAQNFKRYNTYYGENLIKSMNVDLNDFKNNLANYIARWNQVQSRLNQLSLPNVIPIVNRHMFMCSSIYKDEEDLTKAQLYVFTPWYYLKLNTPSGSGMQKVLINEKIPHTWGSELTLGAWIQKVADQVTAIVNDPKFAQISGDIEKAYGTNQVLALGELPLNAPMLEPVHDGEMLWTIHHTRFMGDYGADVTNEISKDIWVDASQSNTPLIFYPQFLKRGTVMDFNSVRQSFYDSGADVPTADENMTSSRFDVICDVDSSDRIVLNSCGTEIIFKGRIINFNDDGTTEMIEIGSNYYHYNETAQQLITQNMKLIDRISVFKKAPMLFEVDIAGTAAQPTSVKFRKYPTGEIKNYTVLDGETVERAHTQGMLAMFAIPDGSRVVSR